MTVPTHSFHHRHSQSPICAATQASAIAHEYIRASHRPPEVIGVEVPRELGIDCDDVYVALGGVPDDGFVVLARCRVGLDVDAEGAVDL